VSFPTNPLTYPLGWLSLPPSSALLCRDPTGNPDQPIPMRRPTCFSSRNPLLGPAVGRRWQGASAPSPIGVKADICTSWVDLRRGVELTPRGHLMLAQRLTTELSAPRPLFGSWTSGVRRSAQAHAALSTFAVHLPKKEGRRRRRRRRLWVESSIPDGPTVGSQTTATWQGSTVRKVRVLGR
jgi:hypothetical protein